MRKTAITLTIAGLFLITALVPASMAEAAPESSKYALIVGSWDDGSAAGKDYGLAGPEYDVRDVGGYLRSIGYEVTELVCAEATPAAIDAAFADVVAKCDSDDSFVFYYTGHGSWVYESMINLYNGASYAESDFDAALENIKTDNVFMCFDCCQAGGFTGWNLGPHIYSIPLFDGIAKEGWTVVSASSMVFSYDGEIGGVFSDLFWREGLIQGLANDNYFAKMAGTGSDARTSVEEAFYYARTAMNVNNQASTPMMDDWCDGEMFI